MRELVPLLPILPCPQGLSPTRQEEAPLSSTSAPQPALHISRHLSHSLILPTLPITVKEMSNFSLAFFALWPANWLQRPERSRKEGREYGPPIFSCIMQLTGFWEVQLEGAETTLSPNFILNGSPDTWHSVSQFIWLTLIQYCFSISSNFAQLKVINRYMSFSSILILSSS